MAFESGPENHRQLRQWVADRLRSDILEGRLKPGEWLRQERLAQEHGVSQTPVREALKQLAAEGLVEHVPYRGIQVVQFSVEDVEDLYACRAAVEGMAARYAAEAITDEELDELQSLHERMVACVTPGELREYRELNRRFHEAVSEASRRSYLMRTLAQLWAAFPTMLWSNIPRIAVTSVPGPRRAGRRRARRDHRRPGGARPGARRAAVRRHIESAGRALAAAMRVAAVSPRRASAGAGRPGTGDAPRSTFPVRAAMSHVTRSSVLAAGRHDRTLFSPDTEGGVMPRKLVVVIGLALLLLLGLAAPVAAQGTTTGSVRGTVKDAEGGVLPGVTVTAYVRRARQPAS